MRTKALKQKPKPFEVGDKVKVPESAVATFLKKYTEALAPHLNGNGTLRAIGQSVSIDDAFFAQERQAHAKSLQSKVRIFSNMKQAYAYLVVQASWSVVEIQTPDGEIVIPTKGLKKVGE